MHLWRNTTDKVCRIAFILIEAPAYLHNGVPLPEDKPHWWSTFLASARFRRSSEREPCSDTEWYWSENWIDPRVNSTQVQFVRILKCAMVTSRLTARFAYLISALTRCR